MPKQIRRFAGLRPDRPSDRERPDDYNPDDLYNDDWPDSESADDAPPSSLSSIDLTRALPVRGRNRDATAPRPRARVATARDRAADPSAAGEGGPPDGTGAPDSWNITYRAARYEAYWLDVSLRPFFEQDLITDVVAQIKGGKEANVYRCRANPNLGVEFLAAKVYRPRRFRSLGNDSLYREGRAVLTPTGVPVKQSDHRIMRAIGKKTAFGVQVAHTSWLMHEYATMGRLQRAGGAVPAVVAANDNAILMGYVGDETGAGPSLQEVRLDRAEAGPLFREILRNVELLLELGVVHGDLSAYNVLYWDGAVTLIDFPQVVSVEGNRAARDLLTRDVCRVADYFARYGVDCDVDAIVGEMWEKYVEGIQER